MQIFVSDMFWQVMTGDAHINSWNSPHWGLFCFQAIFPTVQFNTPAPYSCVHNNNKVWMWIQKGILTPWFYLPRRGVLFWNFFLCGVGGGHGVGCLGQTVVQSSATMTALLEENFLPIANLPIDSNEYHAGCIGSIRALFEPKISKIGQETA